MQNSKHEKSKHVISIEHRVHVVLYSKDGTSLDPRRRILRYDIQTKHSICLPRLYLLTAHNDLALDAISIEVRS
jgi:hypothetical protein